MVKKAPEGEERGEVYSCANDRFQASKVFNEMAAMVRQLQPVLPSCGSNIGQPRTRQDRRHRGQLVTNRRYSAEASSNKWGGPAIPPS